MRTILKIALVTVALVATSFCTTLTYTFTGIGTGIIGDHNFQEAPFTITASFDSGSVVNTHPGIYGQWQGGVAITIDGFPTAIFTHQMSVFDNQNYEAVIFGDRYWDLGLLILYDPAFSTYDVSRAIGPITVPVADPISSVQFNNIPTSMGDLSMSAFNDSFVVTGGDAQVPEPASLMLLGTGLATVAGKLKRKR